MLRKIIEEIRDAIIFVVVVVVALTSFYIGYGNNESPKQVLIENKFDCWVCTELTDSTMHCTLLRQQCYWIDNDKPQLKNDREIFRRL